MKPDTNLRRQVAALFPQLPALSDRQREYARTHRPHRRAYYNQGLIWCPDCGSLSPRTVARGHVADLSEPYQCPHCGSRSRLVYSRKGKIDQTAYFSVITMAGDWHVVRHYLCRWHFRRGQRGDWFSIDEVVQVWVSADGRHREYVARPRVALCGYEDSFQTHKPMALRHAHGAYCIWGEMIYPRATVSALARRNGFSVAAARDALAPDELIACLLQSERYPGLETLVKIGQYALANVIFAGGRSYDAYAAEIRICHRRGYHVTDGRLWCDYIDMLRRQRLDTRNAHYICPRDLKKAHDQLAERINRAERRRRLAEEVKQARKDEANYRRDKAPYLGISFGDEKIRISVFRSVAEIAEEGAAMHHCVFAARYHRRRDSLLLAARDIEGNRIETIEVDLQTFTVSQSRGPCNSLTPHHAHILRLLDRNMDQIRAAAATAGTESTQTVNTPQREIPA